MSGSAVWNDWSCRVRVTVTRADAMPRAREVLKVVMADVSRSANRFTPDSDLSRVNAGAGRLVPVSRLMMTLVDTALRSAADSHGTVDPTIGEHLLRAGYSEDIERIRGILVPTDSRSAVAADWTRVRVDRDLGRVGVPEGMRLDLGATAKAWTADTAAHRIAGTLGTGVLVEVGGDVSVAGRKVAPWQVLVREQAGMPGQRIGLTHGGLATSSTTARRWRTADGDAHHVIDPRTGQPALGPWRTATVWAPSAVAANTASTAAIVLGDAAVDHLGSLGLAARLVDHDGAVHLLGAWPAARAA